MLFSYVSQGMEHQQKLSSNYNGMFIVIVGAYDSNVDAYEESLKSYKLGDFFIQECSSDGASYTAVFHSRVIYEGV